MSFIESIRSRLRRRRNRRIQSLFHTLIGRINQVERTLSAEHMRFAVQGALHRNLPLAFGHKANSQNDEGGLFEEMVRRTGPARSPCRIGCRLWYRKPLAQALAFVDAASSEHSRAITRRASVNQPRSSQ